MNPYEGRARIIKTGLADAAGPVLYWMSRDMRLHGNHALAYADHLARKANVPLLCIYDLDPAFLGGTIRQLTFKIQALKELIADAHHIGVPFSIVRAHDTESEVLRYARKHHVATIVTDFSPLRISRSRLNSVAQEFEGTMYEVDAHNCIPAWELSQKQEFAAYTIRPKVHRVLAQWLVASPRAPRDMHTRISHGHEYAEVLDLDHVLEHAKTKRGISVCEWAHGGESYAKKALAHFIATSLDGYDTQRNDPTRDAQSNLSPYLHYGMIWAGDVARAVEEAEVPRADKDAFLEELIVRRELAENFCMYQPQYDTPESYPDWARTTLTKHGADAREYIYTRDQLEQAQTHDPAWNAAQRQMVLHGKMHGYMRMYWCKKILEWTPDVETAHAYAVYLNDTYELDGRDPNGYAGIAWSLGGVHDRAWGERPIFGMIRYMNYGGLKRKFDVKTYEVLWNPKEDLFGVSEGKNKRNTK